MILQVDSLNRDWLMAAEKKPSPTADIRQIEKRWTKPLADAGWTVLPNVILDKQVALGLDSVDVNIVLQIAKFWWEAGSAPYPSVDTIATAIGVKPRTVQRHITKMVKLGLLERVERFYAKGGQKSNSYTFKGLIEQSTPFAEEVLAERQRKKAAEKARVRRRTPLHVVRP